MKPGGVVGLVVGFTELWAMWMAIAVFASERQFLTIVFSLSSLGAEQKGGSSTFTGITRDIRIIPIAISGSALTYIRALRPRRPAFNGQFIFNEGVRERNSSAEAPTSGDNIAFSLRVSPSLYAFSSNANRVR